MALKGIWSYIFATLFWVNISWAQPVYFLVADVDHTESYIVPIEDPLDITHARNLIEFGSSIGPSIVVAAIECTPDGINRDYFCPTKRLWSWHVQEFIGFADQTIEILDGWPGLVEKDCDWWVANATGKIGFWNYTIVKELGTDPAYFQCNFNQDGIINLSDFQVIANHWLRTDCLTLDCYGTDTDQNGIVNMLDLDYCLDYWLEPIAQPVWFSAWECPTQCHGDADCQSEDALMNRYPVYILDMAIYLDVWGGSSWPAHCGDFNYDPRADFDRDCDVDEGDSDILEAWYGVRESEFPTNCPTQP